MTPVLLAVLGMIVAAVVLAVGLAALFATDPTAPRAHPHIDAGLDILRGRRPQDELEGWR